MEQKIIPFTKGITRSPSDLLCSDSELSECVNLMPEGENLCPIVFPKKIENITPTSGYELVFVHKTDRYKNYIFYYNRSLYYQSSSSPVLMHNIQKPKKIVAIGNTLVVLNDSGISYFLCQSKSGIYGYYYLGNKIPDYDDIRFSLISTVVSSEDVDIPRGSVSGISTQVIDPDLVSKITTSVYGNLEATIARVNTDGKFCFPFFVRYALVMFDGTLIKHSSPILMFVTDSRPLFAVYGTTEVMCHVVSSALNIRVLSCYSSEWRDIIKGVEVYVTPPLYTYDSKNNINRYQAYSDMSYSFTGVSSFSETAKKGDWDEYKTISTVTGFDGLLTSYGISTFTDGRLTGTKNYVADNMADYVSSFYKVAYYPLDALDKIFTLTPKMEEVKCGDLTNIRNRYKMSDDYFTHCNLIPKGIYDYNSRINIYSPKRSFFDGFTSMSNLNSTATETQMLYEYCVTIYVKTSYGDKYITRKFNSSEIVGHFFFYPDKRAYKAEIKRVGSDGTTQYLKLNLTESKYLNAAIYTLSDLYRDFEFSEEKTDDSGSRTMVTQHKFFDVINHAYSIGSATIAPSDSSDEYLSNKLIVSEVDNPYYFPLSGWNTIGTGNITGIGTSTEALSQGQFGAFPLMVFTTDGIWAMAVGDDGIYTAKQPISREVCSNPESITEIDDAVIFVTKSGLKAISGSKVINLSEQMSGPIKSMDCEYSNSTFDNLVTKHDTELDFIDYIQTARIAYDYASSRLVIYHSGSPFSYLYSFKSQNYSSMLLDKNILTNANDYPDSILQLSDYGIYSLLNKDMPASSTERKLGYALTRPMKLDNPMGMKTIHRIKNIGTFNRKNSFARCVVYGSNDLTIWFKLQSIHGIPFKYFRIGLYTDLMPYESVSGSILEVETKRADKIR